MARPTQSYGLFVQQFGRALRPLEGKNRAIIIDHVDNLHHGLPDAPRAWSLDRRERRSRSAPSDVIPVRTCLNVEPTPCLAVYERVHASCPFCGHTPVPAGRSSPEQVDGDLHELDASVLARMRGEVERIDGDALIPHGVAHPVALAIRKRHIERQTAQRDLRSTMALWSGWQQSLGRNDSDGYRRFFWQFGTDVLTAQSLGAADSETLRLRIERELNINNVKGTE
jgi:DNA repair protein RadD